MDEKELKAQEKAQKKAEKAKAKLQKERARKEKYAVAPGGASKAEAARAKRKEGMKKAEEKQAIKQKKKKELTKKQKRIRVLVPVLAALLALLLFFLGYFGVYDRTTTAVKLENGSKVSVAEYQYYYRSMYNYYYSMSQQYEQQYATYYGAGAGKSMTGFDYTKTPAEQQVPETEDYTVDKKYITAKDGKATWADFFTQSAVETSQLYEAIYKQAVDAGVKMSKADTKEMNDFLDEMTKTAKDNGCSLDAYLRQTYGKGMTKNLLKKIYTKQTVASNYMDEKEQSYADAVTEKQVKKYLKKHTEDYYTASVRYYNFSADIDDDASKADVKKANKKAKEKAESFLAKANAQNWTDMVTNEVEDAYKEYYKDNDDYSTLANSNYESFTSTFNEDAAKWVYNDASVGSKKLFESIAEETGAATYYALLMTKAPALEDIYPVSVRHLLIMAKDESKTDEENEAEAAANGTTAATHSAKEAKALAEKYYKEWKSGKATDDSFKELAIAHSEDSGVSENEGLYEDITPDSSYVPEFLDWALADGRKAGDSGIIKTEYGYHVMYCVSVAKDPQWKTDIRKAVGDEKYNKYYDSIADGKEYAIKSARFQKMINRRENRFAQKCIANTAANANASSGLNLGS